MWRPELQPLPCRQTFLEKPGPDGRTSFAVMADTIPAGTVLEISLCVAISLNVVDQFFLWDYVLTGAQSNTVCAREDAEVRWQPVCTHTRKMSLVSNPTGMHSSVIRRANPNYTES